jgi:hypothetical protein
MTNFDQRDQTVFNQYNADTINVFAAQSKAIARVQWRPLEFMNYMVTKDSEAQRGLFALDMFKSLIKTFQGRSYKRFTALFMPEPRVIDGVQAYAYPFFCHEISFASTVRTLASDKLRILLELDKIAQSEQERLDTKKELAAKWNSENLEILGSWQISGDIDFKNDGVLEIVYDPDGKSLSIKSKTDLSTDPADYEHHLKTTSELLSFVGATRRNFVAFLGDISFSLDNWSLMKLMTYLLDNHSIRLGNIRINSQDFEQWEYLNPELESELAGKMKSMRANSSF